MRVLVILNPSAGTLAALPNDESIAAQISQGFESAGSEADVRIVAGPDLAETARSAAGDGFDAVIAGGGDGTLNTIANTLAGGPVAFAVLPLGTHNHFAKELGLPLDLDGAIRALAAGSMEDLDIGEVNGFVFLNFSALGLHPLVVKHREAQREARGRRKFLALFVALLSVLRRLPVLRVRLFFGDTVIRRTTPSVIVCNNAHQMRVFGVESVSQADRGVLNVYLARSTRWWGVVWLIIRAAFRSLQTAKKFESLALNDFTIETRSRHARVSIDGEVTDLQTPLHYRVRPGGLRIIRPGKPAAVMAPPPPQQQTTA
jgi:diacylglycerol kinase family enzyme